MFPSGYGQVNKSAYSSSFETNSIRYLSSRNVRQFSYVGILDTCLYQYAKKISVFFNCHVNITWHLPKSSAVHHLIYNNSQNQYTSSAVFGDVFPQFPIRVCSTYLYYRDVPGTYSLGKSLIRFASIFFDTFHFDLHYQWLSKKALLLIWCLNTWF